MSALPSSAAFDEHLNEQLINCLNLQTNVIQNLAQYSQHISLQLFEIKANVDILANRVINLEYEQQQSYFLPPVQIYIPPPTSDPLFFLRPPFEVPPPSNKPFFSDIFDFTTQPPPPSYLFSTTTHEQPSRSAPFVFDSINSNSITHPDNEVEDENDSYEPTISFKPIVHLSPVEVKTGEEDENILFCERAKLYRFDPPTNQMKERGLGEMKILQHKTTNLCRVLMRREQVFKVCANHNITPQMELKPHQETVHAYIWSAMDYADGVAKHETLCIKFKTEKQGKQFVGIFNKAKEINRNRTDDLPSIGKISLNDDDIIIIGEVKPTREQIELARILQLPLTFYLYENKEPCKGCRGCREDLSSILSDEIQYGNRMNSYDATAVMLENLSNFPSGFFPGSSLPSLMSMVPTWLSDGADSYSPFNMPSPPKDYRMIIKAKRCLPSNRLPPPPPPPSSSSLSSYPDYEQTSFGGTDGGDERAAAPTHQKKSRNFSGNNTESYSLNNYASQMIQNILHRVKQDLYKPTKIVITTKKDKAITSHDDNSKPSIFANSTTSIFGNLTPVNTNTSGFSFTPFGNTPATTTTPVPAFQFSTPSSSTTATTKTDTSSIFTFGTTPKLSFSDLVKQSSDNPSTADNMEKRVFPGHGSLIFRTNSTDTTTTEKNNDDDADDSYEPTVSFKPIVHLLPVETKTGEEDENILFCERAKLYRFDPPTNQMKERGLGEMKILQHKTTNLCRILMRREQVFKVCANHKLTSQTELKEHPSKENAYIWSAMDYADGVAKHETLCIKFKTSDQAKRFLQQFNNAKQTNINIQQ